jgi:hypothetical protein
MGGLGRTINGAYAEYTRAPVTNVALIEADLPWAELAAIPETYATAWTCLFRNLEIQRGQLLVIRGATSSFGQAALKMAVNAGVRVIATTRRRDRFGISRGCVNQLVRSLSSFWGASRSMRTGFISVNRQSSSLSFGFPQGNGLFHSRQRVASEGR